MTLRRRWVFDTSGTHHRTPLTASLPQVQKRCLCEVLKKIKIYEKEYHRAEKKNNQSRSQRAYHKVRLTNIAPTPTARRKRVLGPYTSWTRQLIDTE